MNSRHVVVFLRSGAGGYQAFEDIAHGLVADVVTQLGQGAGNAIIAPAAILLRHANDPVFEFLVDAGPTQGFTLLEPSNFCAASLRFQPRMVSGWTMVATSARAACQPGANLGQGLAFGITQLEASFNLVA